MASSIQQPSIQSVRESNIQKTGQALNVVRESICCVNCGSDKNSVVHHFDAEYFDHEKFETYPWDGGYPLDLTIV